MSARAVSVSDHAHRTDVPRSFSTRATALIGSFVVLASGLVLGTVVEASADTGSFPYAGAPVPIADSPGADTPGPTATATVPVSGLTGVVTKVVLTIDGDACNTLAGSTTVGIDHSFVNDIQIDLVAPDGTIVTVIDRTDGASNNLCQVVLDDDATDSIQGVAFTQAPFTGTWKPNAPLSGFNGISANGSWKLQATDYFIGDVGSIRAFHLDITTAPATVVLAPTKTVIGGTHRGDTVTYTLDVPNTGNSDQADNPGDEVTDVLPEGLTLVSAGASSGTAVATVGTGTVTWNGAIADGDSVEITIVATLDDDATGTISNQATVSYDGDVNGSNEASAVSDDPATADADDPTSFAVDYAAVTGEKTVSGDLVENGTVTYEITLNNSGTESSGDNAGDEFTDVLPAELTLVSAAASSGTAEATIATNTVTWNGSVDPGTDVTITVVATVNAGTQGLTVSNQGTISYDDRAAGSNGVTTQTDDPGVGGAQDPTEFVAADGTAPSVTVNQADDQDDPTSSSPITFTVAFSEDVTGFDADDVQVSGTAGATNDEAVVAGSGSTFSVAVSGMTGPGTVVVTIPAAAAQDAAGNDSEASTSSDNSVRYEEPSIVNPIGMIADAGGPSLMILLGGLGLLGAGLIVVRLRGGFAPAGRHVNLS